MLTLILSMLGMAVISYSETEEKIAVSWRDRIQVSQTAEAGIRVAQQMFIGPGDGELVPIHGLHFASETELNRLGVFRTTRGEIDTQYTGTDNGLFRGPFRDSWERVFGGVRDPSAGTDNYDLRFSCAKPGGGSVPAADCWLQTKINPLLSTASEPPSVQITEISFYAPPTVDGRRYGYATVRVTARKFDARNRVVASETLEAVLGNSSPQPAILSDGDLEIEASRFCGACERVHANGDIDALSGSWFSGGVPPVSATGAITAGSSSIVPPARSDADRIEPPTINPWDLIYRPASAESLSKYFLLTTRTPATEWTDNDPATWLSPRACSRSLCQDYGLEYTAAGVVRPARSAADQGRLYRWSEANRNWDLVQETAGSENPRSMKLEIGTVGERPRFEVWAFDDQLLPGTGDEAELPYNTGRVPITFFRIVDSILPTVGDGSQGITLLVDGAFLIDAPAGHARASGDPAWKASIITAGSLYIAGSTNIDPALPNRVLFISGRDIYIDGPFNEDLSDACCSVAPGFRMPPPESVVASASGAIAAHEQILIGSSATLLGLLIAENEINLDSDRDTSGFKSPSTAIMGSSAMYLASGSRHSRVCNHPVWPWADSGRASILSMRRD